MTLIAFENEKKRGTLTVVLVSLQRTRDTFYI